MTLEETIYNKTINSTYFQMKQKRLIVLSVILSAAFSLTAQYSTYFYSKILNDKSYDYIVGESSGELTLRHITDMAGFEMPDRNFDKMFESYYILDKLKEYGLADVKMNLYPARNKAWSAEVGTLWEVSPFLRKIADYREIPTVLAGGSKDADLTAELIFVGNATDKELEGLELTGKIAVGNAFIGQILRKVEDKGAVGAISYYSPRPLIDPIQIPNSGIGTAKTFGFCISPRDGYALRDRLLRNEKIEVKVQIKSKETSFEYQSPSCMIKGSDPNAGNIIYSAHLFEGYGKLGANDNMSGSAVILEVARTLNKLIEEGKIERPRHNLYFLWGDEFGGTIPWANSEKEIIDNARFNINLDMVGLALGEGKSYFCFHRTTMANSHYSNDIAENLFDYMGTTNMQSILTGNFPKPVVAPSGSMDPFYYNLTYHYGASDHEVFNDWGIQVPGIMMITWPDNQYHTSADRPDKLDATQLKRATVLAATIAYTAATADEPTAIRIATTVEANSARRFSAIYNKQLNELANTPKEELIEAYKTAVFDIQATGISERMTVASTQELFSNSVLLKKQIEASSASIAKQELAIIESITNYTTSLMGKKPSITLTAEEKQAAKLYYRTTALPREIGYGVIGGYGGKHGLNDQQRELVRKLRIKSPAEAARLTLSGKISVLDIKKMVDAQYKGISNLSDFMTFMEELEKAGMIEKVK